MAITVVGSVALDTVETPFAGADGALGGAASYFTIAATLYDTVNLVAVIGDDFPAQYMDYFKSRPVDLRGLQVVKEGKTFRWGGRYELDMNTRETLFTELGVFADFRPTLPQDYCCAAVTFLANIQPQLQLGVLRQAREGGSKLVALDTMNLWIETAHDDLFDVLRGVDVVLIAEDEAREIAGTPNLRTAARTILDLGPKTLIVKQGSYGSLLYSADGAFCAAPAYPLEDVRDPTGAGDAFAGGFLGYLAERMRHGDEPTLADFRRALIHGNIMGSFACEQFSVERLRTLTAEDIASRYQEFVRFTHFEMA